MLIPHFTLPSNPAKKIQLREANVSDCIDFAEIDESHEEEVTTLCLNRLQTPETFYDASLWTAQDRRFAIFWYYIHTESDTQAEWLYDCDHCKKQHKQAIDLKVLADGYKPITGLPYREIEFEGEKIIVKPLSGKDMEDLENSRLVLNNKEELKPNVYRRSLAELRILELMKSIDFGGLDEKAKEEKIKNFSMRQFYDLAEKASGKLIELQHGLDSIVSDGKIYLLLPPHECPEKKGEVTRLRVTFRNSEYIPRL
ncbi:MAG: hypothetical protein HQK79_23065 [Desulfobacterales bacterium]|nr:hypothetical protein [Desulfobacterales bacterium]